MLATIAAPSISLVALLVRVDSQEGVPIGGSDPISHYVHTYITHQADKGPIHEPWSLWVEKKENIHL
jgi:hypothetical protein